jgi:hypothetical protein
MLVHFRLHETKAIKFLENIVFKQKVVQQCVTAKPPVTAAFQPSAVILSMQHYWVLD